MAELDGRFGFSKSGNSEILFAWLMKALDAGYTSANLAIERFLTSMGRRKFLVPIYTKLAATPEGARFARRIYAAARPAYHPVSRDAVDAILK